MLLITIHIGDPFQKVRSFMKWGKVMDITPEDETCCTTQSQEGFLKYAANEYCAKYGRLPVI
jgi:hypothetical protein